jgi:hypothetical protein
MANTPDQLFLNALQTFERQVGEATQYWFVGATVNESARRQPRLGRAFQSSALFWNTLRGGLQYHAIVAVGRVLGPSSSNPVNIDSLLRIVYEHRDEVFSKAAFKARRTTGDEERDNANNLPNLIAGYHEPKRRDFRRLSAFAKKYRRIYTEQFLPIRTKYLAHSDQLTVEQIVEMFSKTRIRDFERLLVFLNTLHDVLWHMYHNGLPPTFRQRRYSVRALVRERLDRLSRRTVQEDTVKQTRRFLEVFVRGSAAGR